MLENFNIERILKTILKNGGDYAEIFYENKIETNIVYEDGKIEKAQSGLDSGIGLRLLINGNTFYAYTNEINEKNLIEIANKLSSLVKSKIDKEISLNMESRFAYLDKKIIPPGDIPIDKKIDKVLQAKNFLSKYDPKIVQFKIVYADGFQKVEIANSYGNFVKEDRVQIIFLTQVVALKDDILQTGYEPAGGAQGFEIFNTIDPIKIAKIAADRAIQNLFATKIKGGRMPVVLSSEAGGTMIHEAIGHGLELDLINDGMSVYKNKIGQKVASEKITIIDDGTIPFKRGTTKFDDEGTPTQKTILVENGILKNYMSDILNAIKSGKQSTGNGRRESYRFKPIPRMTNTYIAPGKDNPEDIIKSVEKGIFVKKMGGGQVNTVTGDFVFEISEGYIIEKGEIGDPIRDTTLIGNGPEILNIIDMVGNDLGFGIGTCGKDGQGVPVSDAQPTLRIPEIVVG